MVGFDATLLSCSGGIALPFLLCVPFKSKLTLLYPLPFTFSTKRRPNIMSTVAALVVPSVHCHCITMPSSSSLHRDWDDVSSRSMACHLPPSHPSPTTSHTSLSLTPSSCYKIRLAVACPFFGRLLSSTPSKQRSHGIIRACWFHHSMVTFVDPFEGMLLFTKIVVRH